MGDMYTHNNRWPAAISFIVMALVIGVAVYVSSSTSRISLAQERGRIIRSRDC